MVTGEKLAVARARDGGAEVRTVPTSMAHVIDVSMAQSIIKLEGCTNWSTWKFQVKVLLRGQGLLEVVEGRDVKQADEVNKAWDGKDAKAQTIIVTRLTEKVMVHVLSCETSADMWKKLCSIYEQKSETNIHIIQQRFFKFKYEEGTEISVFLSKIQEFQTQLKSLGEEISDKFTITKVLMSLPDKFNHFISAWESTPEEKQTYHNLVSRLMIEEERMKERQETSPSEATALIAKKKNVKQVRCFKCSKLGHYQSDCRSEKTDKNLNVNSVKRCHFCNKTGHIVRDCWFKKGKDSNVISKNNKASAFLTFCEGETDEQCYSHVEWTLDSGCSNHMCKDKKLFDSFSNFPQKPVIVGNGSEVRTLGSGQIKTEVSNESEWIDTTINNVLYVPDLKFNLLSMYQLTRNGYVVVTDDSSCKIYKENKICAIAKRRGELYFMNFRFKNECANVSRVKTNLNEWHQRLVHQNIQHVKKVLSNNNIEVNNNSFEQCIGCTKGKMHRLSFPTSDNGCSKNCELIVADVCGPFETKSVGGSRYFLLLKDVFSNYRTVYFLKEKSEVKHHIQKFIKMSENITGNKIKTFRSDNGKEFVNKDVQKLFEMHGITHQMTVPYTPEQNGIAERENRTLVEAARTLLHTKNLSKTLWAEAVNTAAYVLNRTGNSSQEDKTPYEVWTGRTYNIDKLKIFGTPVMTHIPKERRRKLDSKAERGIMVGYDDVVKGYRIYYPDQDKVELKRDVTFLEKLIDEEEDTKEVQDEEVIILDLEGEKDTYNEPEMQISNTLDETLESNYEPCSSEADSEEEGNSTLMESDLNLTGEVPERQRRMRRPPEFYRCNNVYVPDEPKTFAEAMRGPYKSQWQEAINKELETLKDNDTFEYCKRPTHKNIVSSKWVFKVKILNNVNHFKARLVVRGFEQQDKLDYTEIYAPVAKLSTFRLFIAIATKFNWPIYQLDVTGAFLYGDINEEVYLELPEGAYKGSNNIVKLKKSLYGLRKSPKYWNDKFNAVMIKTGFVRSQSDTCLYSKDCKLFVLLYVDDILISGNNINDVNKLKDMLNKEFKMKDMGLISNFIGINVKHNVKTGITELSQTDYLKNVISRFGLENCKPASTPMDYNFDVRILDEAEVDKSIEHTCRQIVGSLMYAVCGTRPDLSVAVSILSRYQNKPSNVLLTALKRILRYVKGTLDYKLTYKCNKDGLVGYCDANWGGDTKDRKSTSGYCFKIDNCLVSWASKKQNSVSLSSAESEYVALSTAASECCWIVNLLDDFGLKGLKPKILCDSQAAISIAKTNTINRTKHIEIRFHFVKDLINKNKLNCEYVSTENQIADMLTKPLNQILLKKFSKMCNLE